ncbi:hypothetical protein NDU88_006762 [Pleurodeles waltl]|uniref:Uncharacterized protein n=1 Tax=Pleurodeles waltl TaxID=8319 RepID=A0AAV7TZG0_PLEWA|nr:hypothetical protein NDU88_006762 [Pleurodeles waltl]
MERKRGAPAWGCSSPHCGPAGGGGREAPREHRVAGAAQTRCSRDRGWSWRGERAGTCRRCPDGELERGPMERSGGAAGPWMLGDGACLTPLPDLNMAPKDRTRGACRRGPTEEHGQRVA